MPGNRMAGLLRRLRREAPPDAGVSADTALITRFAATGDEAAFELLVRRHGAMVLAVCKRVLGHDEDAEDAFQATFLVLARKARTVRRGLALSAWLHRVAVRIARRAAIQRRPTTRLTSDPHARPTPDFVEQGELSGLIDAEIERLSEPIRRAFVLCYIDGLPNAEAARLLGCAVRTVEARLTSARRRLRDRLAQQVELPAGIFALLACSPGMSAEMLATITRAGVTAAQRGLSETIEIVGEPAVRLAEGGIRAMTKTMRIWVFVLGTSLTTLAAGIGWANFYADPPAEAALPAVAPAPQPKPAPDATGKGEAWWQTKEIEKYKQGGKLIDVTADGKSLLLLQSSELHILPLGSGTQVNSRVSQYQTWSAAISPDGKYIATAEGENGVKLRDAKGKVLEALWPKGNLPASSVAFTPDGTKLVVYCSLTVRDDMDNSVLSKITQKVQLSVWDLKTLKELGHSIFTEIGIERVLPGYRLAAHGQFLLKMQSLYAAETKPDPVPPLPAPTGPRGGRGPSNPKPPRITGCRYTLIDAITGKEGKSIELAGAHLTPVYPDPLSPDGKTLLIVDYELNELHFLDTETGKDRFRVQAFRRTIKSVVFSKDGRFIAAATGWVNNMTRDPATGTAVVSRNPPMIAAPSELVIWDAATGRELARLTDKETSRNYSDIAFSPNGSFLVAQCRIDDREPQSITIWGNLPPAETEKPKPTMKVPGASATPKVTISTGTIQSLIQSLAGEDQTDARRVEVLFLASLGRFPTDVEAHTLVAQLSRREDKAAAIRDLLLTLTQTKEFRTHAEELGRLAK